MKSSPSAGPAPANPASAASEPRSFAPPGPGPWEAETTHFPRPITHFAANAFVRGFPVGFAEGSARYGLLLSHFKGALVNGFFYQQPVAFGVKRRPWALAVVTRRQRRQPLYLVCPFAQHRDNAAFGLEPQGKGLANQVAYRPSAADLADFAC